MARLHLHQQLVLVAAIVTLTLAFVAAGEEQECAVTTTSWYGAAWKPSFAVYSTEAAWKKHGDLSKIQMYFNKKVSCLVGVRISYGPNREVTKLLGQEPDPQMYSAELHMVEMTGAMMADEGITNVVIKYDKCINHLALSTSLGQVLKVGNKESNGTIVELTPETAGASLQFMKAYTDELSGRNFMRLQLGWATKGCVPAAPVEADSTQPAGADAAAEPAADKPKGKKKGDANAAAAATQQPDNDLVSVPAAEGAVEDDARLESSDPITMDVEFVKAEVPVEQDSSSSTQDASTSEITYIKIKDSCQPGSVCNDGTCPTSSCALNGMGKDVATMMCFGTNIVPNPILDATTGNPCTNLACKLDKTNCTSRSLLGVVGDFCTGRVVPMGSTAKLHPSGKAFLGFPCIEHRGAVLDLLPLGDYTAKGMFVSKAWKVCDCINGPGLQADSLAIQTKDGNTLRLLPPQNFPIMPHFPFINISFINMSIPDVVAQWVAANDADAALPHVTLGQKETSEISMLIEGFSVPSLVVPKVSKPLLKLPANFPLPVFELPMGNRTLLRVTKLFPNITSLPTIALPKWQAPTITLPQLQLPEITSPNLGEWARNFGVPTIPKLPNLFNATFTDVVKQWAAANEFSLSVPRLQITDDGIHQLKALVPDFRVPSLVVLNMSFPLLNLPSPFSLPVVTIPDDEVTLRSVASVLPKLNTLPSLLIPKVIPKGLPALPQLSLPNITRPNFEDIAIALGVALPKWPKFPSGLRFNISLPDFPQPDFDINLPTINMTKLERPAINLTALTSVLGKIPDLDISRWGELIKTWSERSAQQPLEFDSPAFLDVLKDSSGAVNQTGGVSVSFEVPNVVMQWAAGLMQRQPLPNITVEADTFKQLKKLLPKLPDKSPAMVLVNVSEPYYQAPANSAAADIPTVVIPDELVPKVTKFLPNLTYIPTLLVPKMPSLPEVELRFSLPQITLPEVTKTTFMKNIQSIVASLQTGKSGVAADGSSSSNAETPAAEPTTVTTTTTTTTEATPAPAATTTTPATPAAPAGGVTEPTPVVIDAGENKAEVNANPAAAAAAPPAANTFQSTEVVTEVPAGQLAGAAGSTATVNAAIPESGSLAAGNSGKKTATKSSDKAAQHDKAAAASTKDTASRMRQAGKQQPGPETAYMEPEAFYKLDKETQDSFREIFNS